MHVNPFIQMRLFSVEERTWQVDDLNNNRVFKMPDVAARFISQVENLCFEAAKAELLNDGNADESSFPLLIESLKKAELLVTESRRAELEAALKRFFSLKWDRDPVWTESLQYFIAGFDFPFADYSPEGEGREEVRGRMHRYAKDERDSKRFKQFGAEKLRGSQQLAPVAEAVNRISSSVAASPFEIILDICSGVFGVTKKVRLAWDGEKLLRRTTPSGGSRHPSEGYLLLREPGAAYHVRADGPYLDRISTNPDILNKILPNLGADVSGAFLLSSCFERNMFRYREPRTFRTVHMDVGHLMATAVRYLNAAKFEKIHIVNVIDHGEFSKLSGSDHLEEGLIGAIAFNTPGRGL